jgi:hypothetical protein
MQDLQSRANPATHELSLIMSRGKRFESARRLSSFCFSATLREEAGLDALNAELVGVARETMQPAYDSLWLRPDTPPKGSGGRE